MTAPAIKRVPTYTPHLKVQASGVLGEVGAVWEIFSYSVSVGGSQGVRVDPPYLNGLLDDISAFHASLGAGIKATARLTELKVAQVLPDGKWLGSQPLVRRLVNIPGGRVEGGVSLVHAPQVAMVVTLRTARPGGRGRGRFYLPLPIWPVSTVDGLTPAVNSKAVADAAAAMVNAMNARSATGTTTDRVCVASTFGGLEPVTSVQCGRVLDTVRNRRSSLREAYSLGLAIS